jgi:hypothetical protein
VLVLDPLPDFGGHSHRNEFHVPNAGAGGADLMILRSAISEAIGPCRTSRSRGATRGGIDAGVHACLHPSRGYRGAA